MVTGAVNNHLRILQSQHPLEIESGNFHQVKPWFAGLAHFAPVVSSGDARFREAPSAIISIARRRFSNTGAGSTSSPVRLSGAEKLPWSAHVLEPWEKSARIPAHVEDINVVLWRNGELGYALVSDVDSSALGKLAVMLSGSIDMNRNVLILFSTRIIRLFCYGFLSVILALYFAQVGLAERQIGLFFTLTLAGDAGISLWLTTSADRFGRKRTLIVGALLMPGAGVVFIVTHNVLLLLAAAIIGVISPSGNEIGPFLSVEQAALA